MNGAPSSSTADRKAKGQNERMNGERVCDVAFAGTEGAGDCGRNTTTHAARGRVLDQHDKRKGERHARERIRAKTAKKQSVERDHAGDRKQVENVRRRKPQERGQDRRFEQQLGACGTRADGNIRLARNDRRR